MFYVISYKDVGSRLNWDHIEICRSPALYNSSGDECINDWCGTTNDISVRSHGEFKTVEEAKKYIEENFYTRDFPEYCDYGLDDWRFADDVVERFMLGEFLEMDESEVGDFIYESIKNCISSSTTDDEILALEAELEADANLCGSTMCGHAEDLMREYRQELREEEEDC